MLYKHSLAVDGANERRCLISILEVRTIITCELLYYTRSIERLGIYCHKIFHSVTTVDVKHLTIRAYTVGGIDITTELCVIVQSPVVPIVTPEVIEVMKIGSLYMYYLSEELLLSHVKGGHLKEIIDTVLQHHAMLTSALRSIDELPDLFEIHSGRHLYGYMLAVLHCIESDGHMMNPVGSDIN